MNQTTASRRQILEESLVLFTPDESLPHLVVSVADIYLHRSLLKQIPFTDESFAHMTLLVRDAVESHARFRVLDCLKVLRAVIKRAPENHRLPEHTVENVVAIYQELILRIGEDGQWCLSRLLLGQPVSDVALQWLIANWNASEHITNRLLRYPEKNVAIAAWARAQYEANTLANRKSEIIALLIDARIPAFTQHEPPEVLAWAIYYARTVVSAKVALLQPLISKLPVEMAIDLARRFDSKDLIHKCLVEIDRKSRPTRRSTRPGTSRRVASVMK